MWWHKVVRDMYTLFWWEMRLLLINKKVENKNVNPILACSCQQYRFWMAFTVLFHHYPTMKKKNTSKIILKKWYILAGSLRFISRPLTSTISLRLHRAMRESDFMLLLFLNIFCVRGKGQISENMTPAGSAKHITKTAFAFISPTSSFTRHTSFFS